MRPSIEINSLKSKCVWKQLKNGLYVQSKSVLIRVLTLKYGIDMRRRFSMNAVASSDGAHVRVSHDRRANATGRSNYTFLGKKIIVTEGNVFRNGHWIGKCITDDQGNKFVSGPYNNGNIAIHF